MGELVIQHCNFNNKKFKKMKCGDRKMDDGDGVRLASMHRVKGLEFTHMIIASVNKGVIPLEYAIQQAGDQVSREEAETRERCLMYVAATRARGELLVTSYGEPSEFLEVGL